MVETLHHRAGMPLSQVIQGIAMVSPELDCDITAITIESQQVTPGCLFIAYPGLKIDSRLFIPEVIAKGAAAVLYDQSSPLPDEALAAIQDDTHRVACVGFAYQPAHLGQMAAQFYQKPSAQMDITAVTGSNGKTSVAFMVATAMMYLGHKYGFVGTLGAGFPDAIEDTGMTTPHALALQKKLSDFLYQGAEGVVFEASSHGIALERLSGCYVDTAVFTNFRADHLDYHGTEEAYFEAKAKLFERPELQHALIHGADPMADRLISKIGENVRVVRYQMMEKATEKGDELVGYNLSFSRKGLTFSVCSPWGEGVLTSPLWGHFQAQNLLAALGVLLIKGIAFDQACEALAQIDNIPGRMQVFGGKDGPLIVIDYAHNGDGLSHALTSLRALSPRKLWCVFGCGGGRDQARRSEMGKVAELHCDQLILTNDNPRDELPEAITEDILSGLVCPWAAVVEHDRNRAIAHAIEHASNDDIVLIAGKGHETTIEVKGEKIPHSDVAHVQLLLGLKGVA